MFTATCCALSYGIILPEKGPQQRVKDSKERKRDGSLYLCIAVSFRHAIFPFRAMRQTDMEDRVYQLEMACRPAARD